MKIYIAGGDRFEIQEFEYNWKLTPTRRKKIKNLFTKAFSDIWKCSVTVTFEDEHFLYK